MSVWRYLLTPASDADRRATAWGVIALLVVSAAALVLAPAFMPAGYDWVRHTTSESAAQGLAGAWVARLGFVAFGLAASAIPLIMVFQADVAGLVQRLMFAVAYVWYAAAAWEVGG